MIERDGRVIVEVIPNVRSSVLRKIVKDKVKKVLKFIQISLEAIHPWLLMAMSISKLTKKRHLLMAKPISIL